MVAKNVIGASRAKNFMKKKEKKHPAPCTYVSNQRSPQFWMNKLLLQMRNMSL